MIVGIDTMVAIHLSRSPNGSQKPVDLLVRRAHFVAQTHERDTICLPLVSVAELLVKVPPERHKDAMRELDERYFLQPFDAPASHLAAALRARIDDELPSLRDTKGRSGIWPDVQIVASCYAAKCGIFYSADGECQKLAKLLGGWEVRDLPTIGPSLFSVAEQEELPASGVARRKRPRKPPT